MKWTTERPTKIGWYFFRDKIWTSNCTKIIQVLRLSGPQGNLDVLGWGQYPHPLASFPKDAQFAGPIEKPEEP
jgi:hypothetical protein